MKILLKIKVLGARCADTARAGAGQILRAGADVAAPDGAKLCQDLFVAGRTTLRVGLIADTHGLLRREAWQFLLGSQHIVHAGDIGDQSILEELRSIAPLSVVRGNNDTQPWASQLPETARLTIGGVHIEVLHDRKARTNAPRAPEVHVVITGHSHAPRLEWQEGVLYINPGSAGPRRFKLPIAIGELVIAVGGTAAVAASGDRASGDRASAARSFAARIVDLESGQPLASLG